MSEENTQDLAAEIARLRAENAQLKAKPGSFRVSAKGAVSVYGLGRFPVTLYREQWDKLLAQVDQIREFIDQNADKLTVKARPGTEAPSANEPAEAEQDPDGEV